MTPAKRKQLTTKEPFFVHCGKCSHEWAAAYLPLPVDVFVKLGKAPCPMCGAKQVLVGKIPKPTADGDALAWLGNGDTGLSSETIWRVLMGEIPTRASIPLDPDDFGRCYRLLKVMPAWRSRLGEVAATFPVWAPLVDAWDELTALYEQEMSNNQSSMAPKLYERMQQLQGKP